MKASPKKSPKVWVVVLVESGVISEVSVYADRASALKHAQTLHTQMSENDDDLGIFEGLVGRELVMQIRLPETDD
jgi:hypothetical protein